MWQLDRLTATSTTVGNTDSGQGDDNASVISGLTASLAATDAEETQGLIRALSPPTEKERHEQMIRGVRSIAFNETNQDIRGATNFRC